MTYKTAGFTQVSTAALGVGVHETININDIIADREGYVLAYLSNENSEAVNMHWDDFTVYHGKTNVVSTQDYYPFGLTFNESVRVASTEQRFGFNGKEKDNITGWNDFGFRGYDPQIGRFMTIDPLADMFSSHSPYNYAQNNPIRFIDFNGLGPGDRVKNAKKAVGDDTRTYKQVLVGSGTRYTDKYVDCSEFAREIALADGYDPGDWTGAQAEYYQTSGEWVTDISEVKEGDFVFWSHKDANGSITHTGIVSEITEDGKLKIIQSTLNGGGESINDKYKTNSDGDLWSGSEYQSNFVGAGRPLNDSEGESESGVDVSSVTYKKDGNKVRGTKYTNNGKNESSWSSFVNNLIQSITDPATYTGGSGGN